MVFTSLLVYCCLLVLCLKQSESSYYNCDKICARWEGSKYALNGICRRRYLNCLEEELYPSRGKWNTFNAIPHLTKAILTKSDVPCVDIRTKQEIDNTMCREVCHSILNETQIEMPLEACREDTFCCKRPERVMTRLEALVNRDRNRYRPEPNVWKHGYNK